MDRIFFEEKQKLPGVLSWIVLLGGLAVCFPFIYTLYARSILHQSLSENAFSNQEAGLALVSLLVGIGLVVLLVSRMYLELKIDHGGIHYRLFPHHWKIQFLERAAISDYTIRKLKWIEIIKSKRARKYGQSGSKQYYRITGNTALELNVRGGRKLIISTRNPEGLTWAMKRLMSNP